MDIKLLGYVAIGSNDLPAWERFARRVLACETVRRQTGDGTQLLGLRMDDKCHRLLLIEGANANDPFFGLEVEGELQLQTAATEFRARGIQVTAATPAELELRRVSAMVHVRDPAGYRLEIYHGLQNGDGAFQPTRPMGGFCMGELGFGHAVLVVPNLEVSRDFYCDVLGFGVSDYLLQPTRRVFLHVNRRHHSIALSERAGRGIAHLMFEVKDFDDVGRSYDVAMSEYREQIFSTLGRHANDFMTSFYIQTPNGFPIEYGWGGREIDPGNWKPSNLFGPSLWGHDRPLSAPDARGVADAQRRYAFEHGLRAPLGSDVKSPIWMEDDIGG